MKRVTSISLGSSLRNKSVEADFLGEKFQIERVGTDGDLKLFQKKLIELDGKVDAFGLGGTDMYIYAAGKRYTFRQIERLAAAAVKTPVVDGSGLKNTLERETVQYLQREGIIDLAHSKVLLVCAVDRFGMAEALDATGASVVYGDLMFAVGVPIALRSMTAVNQAARVLLPLIVQLPFQWLYPTGEKQNTITPKWTSFYDEADVIAGDFPYIRRYMPENLAGKTILTNTTTAEDVLELTKRGVKTLITTTPQFEGRSFGTNVMEGVLVTLSGRKPEELTPKDYMDLMAKLNWKPRIQTLNS
ncbi:MAG: quinate 5-dehydrogenase [Capsulimonas sp.]|uniref:quinate 5-dehydrogenase n=1 Tax=Capsulimonas sp. TaxID=2494211 RepID=UPI003266D163